MPQGLRVRVSSCPPKIMKIKITSKKGLKTNLSIFVDKQAIQKRLDERLLELKDQVNLKGFRPGKVPPSVIKSQFGKAIYGEVIDKLLKETSKYPKCVFISFKHRNIYNLLKIKNNTKVGLSFSPPTNIKTIAKKSNNKKIDCLILDKFFLKSKIIQNLKIKKYYYTIKKKSEFNKYSKNNNLIFENL